MIRPRRSCSRLASVSRRSAAPITKRKSKKAAASSRRPSHAATTSTSTATKECPQRKKPAAASSSSSSPKARVSMPEQLVADGGRSFRVGQRFRTHDKRFVRLCVGTPFLETFASSYRRVVRSLSMRMRSFDPYKECECWEGGRGVGTLSGPVLSFINIY